MDSVVWLRSLGLGKYEVVFRENDIDETVLTAEDLKGSLAVANLRARRTTAISTGGVRPGLRARDQGGRAHLQHL